MLKFFDIALNHSVFFYKLTTYYKLFKLLILDVLY